MGRGRPPNALRGPLTPAVAAAAAARWGRSLPGLPENRRPCTRVHAPGSCRWTGPSAWERLALPRLLCGCSESGALGVPQRGLGRAPHRRRANHGQEGNTRYPAAQPPDRSCPHSPQGTPPRPPHTLAPSGKPEDWGAPGGPAPLGGTTGVRTSCLALQGCGVQGQWLALSGRAGSFQLAARPLPALQTQECPSATGPRPGSRAQRWPVHTPARSAFWPSTWGVSQRFLVHF